jgi:Protein of unknown function (DUF998)
MASATPVTAPPLASVAAARLSVAAATTFIALLAALHLIKPELDPSWRVISEYAIGSHGWLMAVVFLSLAVARVALVVAIQSDVKAVFGYIGVAFRSFGVGDR